MFIIKMITIALLIIYIFQMCKCGDFSEEDSKSIEIPNRPENRQKYNSLNPAANQESLLSLFSKLLSTVKLGATMASRKFQDTFKIKGGGGSTRKATRNLQRAYNHVEKARKHMVKESLGKAGT